MSLRSNFVWINGELVDFDQATVPFLSPTLHYGVGAFEGIRTYLTSQGPAVFRLREHMQRFLESGKVLGLREFSYTVDDLMEAVRIVVKKNEFAECYIRPLIYFTGNSIGLNLDAYDTNIGIAAWEWSNYLGAEARKKGVRACISSFTRLHPNAFMTKAKITGNYANSILAKTESTRLGFEEAIMLDPEGYVSECTGENIFLVRKQQIYTPTIASTLEGITRDSIITLAKDHGFKVHETKISRDQLYTADEVFICGTAAEVSAIREIDFRQVGLGNTGTITSLIQEEYHKAIHGAHKRSQEWLFYINTS